MSQVVAQDIPGQIKIGAWEKISSFSRKFAQVLGKMLAVLLANVPLALISLPASYGAAMFSEKYYPNPWNLVLGGAFESTYLGAMIFAQKKNKPVFITTILVASFCGVLFNTLHVAQVEGLVKRGGDFGDWLLSFVHGGPLSFLGLAYAALLHFSSDTNQVSKKISVRIQEAAQAVSEPLQAEIAKLNDLLKQWQDYANGMSKRLEDVLVKYRELDAKHERLSLDIEAQFQGKIEELQAQVNNHNALVGHLTDSYEQRIKDMETSHYNEMTRLLDNHNQELAELRNQFDKKPAAQITVLKKNQGGEDEVMTRQAEILQRFKAEPTIANLIPAFAEGINDNTIAKWIQRYKADFTLGQAKAEYNRARKSIEASI